MYDIFYKGFSEDVNQRLIAHNENMSNYTKNKGPWELVFLQSFESKSEALKMEKMLKRQNRKYILWLIKSDRNEMKKS